MDISKLSGKPHEMLAEGGKGNLRYVIFPSRGKK